MVTSYDALHHEAKLNARRMWPSSGRARLARRLSPGSFSRPSFSSPTQTLERERHETPNETTQGLR